jgi:ABC-2 type transport system permease protein
MNRILTELINSSRMYLRSKTGAFFTFAFPILLVLLFGAIFTSMGSSKITLPVQNLDTGTASHEFLANINATGLFKIDMIAPEKNLDDYIRDNSLTLALQIPANFSANVAAMLEPNSTGVVTVTLYGDVSQSSFGTAQSAIGAAADIMNFKLANARPIIVPVTAPIGGERMTYMDFFLPGVVGLTVMTTSLYAMTAVCSEYRSRGYFKLLATTKLRKHEWLISRFLLYTVMLYISLFATFAIGRAAFKMTSTLTPLALALIPAGSFLFVSLGMLLSTVVKDPESANAIANIIGFPMMFLSGSFFPIELFPAALKAVATILPLTYLNYGLRDAMVYGNSSTALVDLGILLVVGFVFALLASRLLSWKER